MDEDDDCDIIEKYMEKKQFGNKNRGNIDTSLNNCRFWNIKSIVKLYDKDSCTFWSRWKSS